MFYVFVHSYYYLTRKITSRIFEGFKSLTKYVFEEKSYLRSGIFKCTKKYTI